MLKAPLRGGSVPPVNGALGAVQGQEKPLHGVFVRETKAVADEEWWKWMRNGYLTNETEGMIYAGQEQA